MKLYEAIELGSTIIKESRNFLKDQCGCALGTAAGAISGADKTAMNFDEVLLLLGDLKNLEGTIMPCPEGCLFRLSYDERYGIYEKSEFEHEYVYDGLGGLLSTVSHLHFFHGWKRQRIAEWLKPIEDALEANQLVESSITSSSVKEPVLVR